ncbi:MAG: uroporphyrinogen-III synthase [Pseudomonadota bacterium]
MADNGAPLILLTRARAQSERFAEHTKPLAETRIIPLLEILPTGEIPPLGGFSGLIFTSENAVRLVAEAEAARGMAAWCVGKRTGQIAAGLGFRAHTAGGTAEDLVSGIVAAKPAGPLIHLHGRHTRGNIAARLTSQGIATAAAEIYDQRAVRPAQPLARLAQNRPVFVPLFSPRSAVLFSDAIGAPIGDWRPLCLSAAVHGALPGPLRDRALVADAPCANAMLRLMKGNISP